MSKIMDNQKVLLAALKAIRNARDFHAEHSRYPAGIGNCFDDWAADVADEAIRKVEGISQSIPLDVSKKSDVQFKPMSYKDIKVGDSIPIFDLFDSNNPVFARHAIVSKIQKKFIQVQSSGEILKFHRSTGFVVGFHWPHIVQSICPETN